ncbi:unnamed protein product [Allacma fusca]|uniref:C2 domain-containing protein n=1 Tax=Allacma fusca TaxID=39272 RepID=A0A8J2JZP9_9HEXA|nr:unnamed protein product [Allacma fusca]
MKSPGVTQNVPEPFNETSVIDDDSNPEWPEKFSYIWRNGTGQTWLFLVFDHDHLSSNDPIGYAEVSVDGFMKSEGSLALKLEFSQKGCSLVITQYPYRGKRTVPIAFKLSATNLPRPGIFFYTGTIDPYAVISYRNDKNTEVNTLQKTGIFKNGIHPTWTRPIEFTGYEPNTSHPSSHTTKPKLYESIQTYTATNATTTPPDVPVTEETTATTPRTTKLTSTTPNPDLFPTKVDEYDDPDPDYEIGQFLKTHPQRCFKFGSSLCFELDHSLYKLKLMKTWSYSGMITVGYELGQIHCTANQPPASESMFSSHFCGYDQGIDGVSPR